MIELGIFLLCLGGMVYLLSKAHAIISKAHAIEKSVQLKKTRKR